MADDTGLIPELVDWRKENGEAFSILDWITANGDVQLAIGYTKVFWPDFIEYDGCIFFKDHFSIENYESWVQAESIKNYGQVERVINHFHILDLFSLDKQKVITYPQVKYLGGILQSIYGNKLRADFPKRKFEVFFNGEEELEDLIDYQLGFYQLNNDKRKIHA